MYAPYTAQHRRCPICRGWLYPDRYHSDRSPPRISYSQKYGAAVSGILYPRNWYPACRQHTFFEFTFHVRREIPNSTIQNFKQRLCENIRVISFKTIMLCSFFCRLIRSRLRSGHIRKSPDLFRLVCHQAASERRKPSKGTFRCPAYVGIFSRIH